MDKKTKIFFIVFFVVVFIAIAISGYRFFVLKDYYIISKLSCDPVSESCFMESCDPSEDDACPVNEDERISYYKLMKKKAYNIPFCSQNNVDCPPLSCENDASCQLIFCDQKNEDCSNLKLNSVTNINLSDTLSD